jgi:hypothetical protein
LEIYSNSRASGLIDLQPTVPKHGKNVIAVANVDGSIHIRMTT